MATRPHQIRENGELLVGMCRGESHFCQKWPLANVVEFGEYHKWPHFGECEFGVFKMLLASLANLGTYIG